MKKQIKKDIGNGHIPFFACATLGTTSSTGIDSVKEIGKVCDQYDLWMHVDAAMAGTASLCPEYQYIQEGINYADSYSFNPHKWMLTNFDCSCLFIKSREVLTSALEILPEYLKTDSSKKDKVIGIDIDKKKISTLNSNISYLERIDNSKIRRFNKKKNFFCSDFSKLKDSDFITKLAKDNFDLSPRGIRDHLSLHKPIYKKSAAYGHFGRDDKTFSWELIDKAKNLIA